MEGRCVLWMKLKQAMEASQGEGAAGRRQEMDL